MTGTGDCFRLLNRLDAIAAKHKPMDEEAEFWFDMPGHHERFPECDTERQCEGHTITVQVCQECGYEHDGDMALFRAWPCPTYTLATVHIDGVGSA